MNLIFPHIFSHFAIPHPSEWESFEESTRAFLVLSSRADTHLPTVGRLSPPWAGQSAGCGTVQPVGCQAEESWTTACFFPRWVWPVTGYLLSTDLPLMLTRRAQRETHLNQPVITQNAEGYYSALQLLIPVKPLEYLCLNYSSILYFAPLFSLCCRWPCWPPGRKTFQEQLLHPMRSHGYVAEEFLYSETLA